MKTYPWSLAVGMMLGCVGCADGERVYPVTGHVEYADGAPLTHGWVEFERIGPQPALSARGEIQPDGSFRLGTFDVADGAPAGEHRAIVAVPLSDEQVDNPRAARPRIDPRFSNFEQSGFRFHVTRDSADNDFVLTVHPPR